MNDWNEYREQLTLRLREFSKLAPETMKGIASLGKAGEKTNHLDAKTRELVSLVQWRFRHRRWHRQAPPSISIAPM